MTDWYKRSLRSKIRQQSFRKGQNSDSRTKMKTETDEAPPQKGLQRLKEKLIRTGTMQGTQM